MTFWFFSGLFTRKLFSRFVLSFNKHVGDNEREINIKEPKFLFKLKSGLRDEDLRKKEKICGKSMEMSKKPGKLFYIEISSRQKVFQI